MYLVEALSGGNWEVLQMLRDIFNKSRHPDTTFSSVQAFVYRLTVIVHCI